MIRLRRIWTALVLLPLLMPANSLASNPSRLNLRSKSHSSWERTPARCHCERKSSNSTAPSKFSSDSGSGCAAEVSSEVTECRSEEHTSELQSHSDLVCRLLLEKKKQENAH